MKAGFRADFAVALEPTDLKVVAAAKGVLRVWIAVPGRAAHGAKPERGDNAVYRALPLVQAGMPMFRLIIGISGHPMKLHKMEMGIWVQVSLEYRFH